MAAGALPDGTPVIISGGDDGRVQVRRMTDGSPVGEPLRHGGRVTAVAAGALPDSTPVIISGGPYDTVRVWRMADGSPVGQPLTGHTSQVDAVAAGALPDGTPVIISGSHDFTVRVWRMADGTRVGQPLTGHDGWVDAVAAGALPDGTPVIISGSHDRTVRVWRLADGTPVGQPLTGHDGAVSAVAAGALPDGTPVIISGSDDRTVRVWRMADGTPVGEALHLPESVKAVAVNGHTIVTAAGTDIAAAVLSRSDDRPVNRPDNGRLSGTSGHDAWRGPGNGRAAVYDSDTLSGTSVEEERPRRYCASQTPSMIQGADLTVGQLPTIPCGLLRSWRSEHVPCRRSAT